MTLPRCIGLTGGIGSGKSTVAGMFAALAVPILDLDSVGRELLLPGSEAMQQVADVFGAGFILADGSLDRQALAAHCFADSRRTDLLNGIMHPLIWRYEQQWLEQQSAPYVLIEASVLLESGTHQRMHAVVVVLADEQLRLQRVLARGDRNRQQFNDIVSRQCSDKKRRDAADYLIMNNASLALLEEQVKAVHQQLLQA